VGAQTQESRIPKLSLAERETVIVKTSADAVWCVYSCEKRMVEKIRKLAAAYHVPVREQNFGGVEADLPIRAVALRGPSRRPPMTDEQRAEAGKRLAARRGAQ
jgi:hypothetical protein